jgi:hypothetical protein
MHYSTADHTQDNMLFMHVKQSSFESLSEQRKNVYRQIATDKIIDDAFLRTNLVDLYAKASFVEQITRKIGLEDTRGEDLTEQTYKLIGRYVIAHNKQEPSDLVSVDLLLNQAKLVPVEHLFAFFLVCENK